MKSFLIIRAGKTYPEAQKQFREFDEFFINRLAQPLQNLCVIDAQEIETFPSTDTLCGVLITGAHENVTEQAKWMNTLKLFIKSCYINNLPILGVCFGHQIIAEALGGKVDYHKNGGEYGLIKIAIKHSFTFFGLNMPKVFNAYLSHEQTIVHLPTESISYAGSEKESNQIVYFGKQTWGFQFHPEFTYDIMAYYLKKEESDGQLGSTLEANDIVTFGTTLLNTFVNYCIK